MQNGANSYLYSVFSKSTYPRGWGGITMGCRIHRYHVSLRGALATKQSRRLGGIEDGEIASSFPKKDSQ